MAVDIFISHCVHDREIAAALQQDMEREGLSVRTDNRVIRDGDPLQEDVRESIESAAAFVLVVSPKAAESVWVQQQTQYALKLRREEKGCRLIVPILLDGAELGALKWCLPEDIAPIHINGDRSGMATALLRILHAVRA